MVGMNVGGHQHIDRRRICLHIARDPLAGTQAFIRPRRRDQVVDAGRGAGVDQQAGAIGADDQGGIAAAGIDVVNIEFTRAARG